VPNTGQRLEDVFVGKALLVSFAGDRTKILEDTERELRGEPLDGRNKGAMTVSVLNVYRLNPRDTVCIPYGNLLALAGKQIDPNSDLFNDPTYVPRIPIDAAEADAMLSMSTIFADATNPTTPMRTYAGYTDDELRGKPAVLIR
jgi:hypothetical protein